MWNSLSGRHTTQQLSCTASEASCSAGVGHHLAGHRSLQRVSSAARPCHRQDRSCSVGPVPCGVGRRQHVQCQASKAAAAAAVNEVKEAHKIFDEAVITVKSGDGGNGEIVEAGRGKYVKNNKYNPGGNQPKQIWLTASEPAEGADGADVYVVCDPALDNLLHLHKRKSWVAAKGSQGNPAVGSAGPKRNAKIKKATTPSLDIPVPPGTVVKRKSTGQVLGEVLQPGDRLLVAKGGKGGMGTRAPSRTEKQRDLQRELKNVAKSGGEVVAIEDVNWKDDAKGLPGRQLGLQLMLRVVADVGIVGFPNAGKSSLLSSLTRASPEVAPYPFTTLMPNLGVMAAGQGPVLADLPGLIEGAHTGKGLGRMFLRHLRRTRLLLHVVDASAPDPGTDYLAVREELRMYNPDYVTRPHVVALNKMDLEDAGSLRQEVADEVMAAAQQLQQQHSDIPGLTAPAAIVACSAVSGEGVQQLAAALQAALQQLSGSQQQLEVQQLHHEPAAAAVPTTGSESDDEREWDDYEGGWEGEEDEDMDEQSDWADSSLMSAAGATELISSSAAGLQQSSTDEDTPPPPLAADDPDKWLFELSEEQLLAMADEDA